MPKRASLFTLTVDAETGRFCLAGKLTLDSYAEADKALHRQAPPQGAPLVLDGSQITEMDTAGALLLHHFRESVRPAPVQFVQFSPAAQTLITLIDEAHLAPPSREAPPNAFIRLLERMGKSALSAAQTGEHLLAFLGQMTLTGMKILRRPARLRLDSICRHIDETGLAALPIVGLVAFLIAVVLAYQGAFQLKPLGAEAFTVNLVGVSVLREMAVLLTSIMVAGRSGSAFTAEIGMMKVNQEIDALAVIGIGAFDSLVIPRLLALMITLPLLTFAADMLGLLGGGVICSNLLNIPWVQYADSLRHAVKFTDFLVGLIKAPVFALIIAHVACLHGLEVSGSAESVGRRTTASVVHSIFLVLVADALFSILFVQIGI